MESVILDSSYSKHEKVFLREAILACELEIKCKKCGATRSAVSINGGIDNDCGYALLADLGNDGIRILSVGQSAGEIMGYAKEEFCAMRMHDIDLKLSKEMYAKLWKVIRFQPFIYALDTLQRKKSGEAIAVKMNFKFLKIECKEYAFVIVNIYSRPSQNINSFEAAYLIQDRCNFLSEIDLTGRFLYLNANVSDALGYAAVEILGQSIFDFLPADEIKEKKKKFITFAKFEQPFRILNCGLLSRKGEVVKLDAYFVPYYYNNNKFTGYTIVSWPSQDGDVRQIVDKYLLSMA